MPRSNITTADRRDEAIALLSEAQEHIQELKSEFEGLRDGLPENLQQSGSPEELETEIERIDGAYRSIEEAISNLADIELPRGF